MKKIQYSALVLFIFFQVQTLTAVEKNKTLLRAPAYPLITIDPYTSAWSAADNLYDKSVTHWTGKDFPLMGILKVDGKPYRFMGSEKKRYRTIVGTSIQEDWLAKYTTKNPGESWFLPHFDDSDWAIGEGAFGTRESENTAKTQWGSENIWIRREIVINDDLEGKNVYLNFSHDDDAVIYINGVKVVETGNSYRKNVKVKLEPNILKKLKRGVNIIAATCRNRIHGGLLDVGISEELPIESLSTAIQNYADVQAMNTHYNFTCGSVSLDVTFTAPLFLDDLEYVSRPINYITYRVRSLDEKEHNVEVYFEIGPHWALNNPQQKSETVKFTKGNLSFFKSGTVSQQVLVKRGDDVRIDWGYVYFATSKDCTESAIGNSYSLRSQFVQGKPLVGDEVDGYDYMAFRKKCGNVKVASGYLMLGYDDLYSIQYFNKNLRPYWNRKGDVSILSLFDKADKEYSELINKTLLFDKRLMQEAEKVGGREYAELCALAYRQAVAAHKLVENEDGQLFLFSKENFSNGSIGTVDLTYPGAPLFMYYNTELLKATMNFIFDYVENKGWNKPFAAHDVGTYPIANGQTYGGDMPIEESGNMLLLTAALAQLEANADYAKKHWKTLTTWVDYLVENGLDPKNQLCTDDFAGHFAHNANLSIKAILGIASYAKLAKMLGNREVGTKYYNIAQRMAKDWEKMADDGDHYRLTFDKCGTWSQKYNLVWDRLLDFNLFSKNVVKKEIKYYLTVQNKYGLPLDSRKMYTKTDWVMWTATLSKNKNEFAQFIVPIYRFMNETVDRVPMSDWIYTDSPIKSGFQARSVVGGYYLKLVEEKLKGR